MSSSDNPESNSSSKSTSTAATNQQEEPTSTLTEEQRKNNPDNNPIRDQRIIEKKIKKLEQIHSDWHQDSHCTCCQHSIPTPPISTSSSDESTTLKVITSENLYKCGEQVKKVYNSDRGLYWDWLSVDDVGKKCFYYLNDPFHLPNQSSTSDDEKEEQNEEYSNIAKFFIELQNNYQLIRSELDNLLKQQQESTQQQSGSEVKESSADFQAWPETICKTKGKWKVYPLGYAFGRDLTNEPTKCPQTVQLLAKLNRELGVHITTAGFSCLSSQCYISEHRGYCGYSNHCLRVHMGLIVPQSNHHACAIRVGNVRHCWNEGVVFAFDDYITHEAYNFTDQDRYILLLDIRFREMEKFKFYSNSDRKNRVSSPPYAAGGLGAKLIEAMMKKEEQEEQFVGGSGCGSSDNKWKGIESKQQQQQLSSGDDSAGVSSGSGNKTFVTLKKYVTNDIECLNANYSEELKDMLKNVVDKK